MSEQEFRDYNEYEQDAQRAEKYIKNVYAAKVPAPKVPNVGFASLVGWKTFFFAMAALGALVFSAIRTGGYFFVVEQILLSNYNIEGLAKTVLSTAAFVSALFAFEGYAVAEGFSKGSEMKDTGEGNSWGFWASFLTIAVVGIFSGMEIVELEIGIKNVLNIATALFSSVSAALIAFFGGKNLGFAYSEFQRRKTSELEQHQERYDAWHQKAYASYTSTIGGFNKRVQNEQQNVQNQPDVQNTVQSREEKLSKPERSFNWVEGFVQSNERIPTVTEVSDATEVSRGTASYAINDFICANANALLADRLVDEERANQACLSVEKRNV